MSTRLPRWSPRFVSYFSLSSLSLFILLSFLPPSLLPSFPPHAHAHAHAHGHAQARALLLPNDKFTRVFSKSGDTGSMRIVSFTDKMTCHGALEVIIKRPHSKYVSLSLSLSHTQPRSLAHCFPREDEVVSFSLFEVLMYGLHKGVIGVRLAFLPCCVLPDMHPCAQAARARGVEFGANTLDSPLKFLDVVRQCTNIEKSKSKSKSKKKAEEATSAEVEVEAAAAAPVSIASVEMEVDNDDSGEEYVPPSPSGGKRRVRCFLSHTFSSLVFIRCPLPARHQRRARQGGGEERGGGGGGG
jgi:hypothetical protein